MGWQDRDYNRDYGDNTSGGAKRTFAVPRWSVTQALIVANIAVFVLCTLTGEREGPAASPIFQWTDMQTPLVLRGQVWRLFTANFLHWNFSHILMNMLGLYFLGKPLERDWGPRRYLGVYIVAGLAGYLFYLALSYFGWLPIGGIAAGASGSVLGLLGVCAVRYPTAEVLIYFLVPMKIRTMAILFGAWYALNVYTRGSNAGGDACHLAGMIFGVWWALKGDAWWAHRPQVQSKVKPFWSRTPARRNFEARWEERRVDEESIDRILKKVYDSGIHSLSETEKETLKAATERQRQREAQAGRTDRL